ncbi:P-type conjugative transfer protein TrbG [Photobacterium damselae]|uniref:P-type conjugative transfer protein TrbG n=1 Tax=Photobacterium damselae TaxID=38293 RepID=UPI0010FDF971|nr:P-type conjugative transfer protein TrbG [Photobacterium damselae]KAB1512009.1 P-type conjugative transfer protein TrbG [Photobacterium damselae subsp. damselae]TLS72281.1 P-type conjugative transfer protein TrbG [Photobacterium damselae subsp. damselae]TLS80265.1 P-type conjugative transfer protein TrbG [Photobacterium damselae subsp. damselae]TLS82898.1 P-type conjugative transfer protein TrbG [Photobacterium damselae subsp. damselae]
MQKTKLFALGLLVSCSSYANIVPPLSQDSLDFLSPDIPLSTVERAGVKLAQKWINGKTKPITRGDGSVTYFYGAVMPTVVCSPLNLCDIQLQPGEEILPKGLNASDTVRWTITPMVSNSPNGQITHVMVKPTDSGLTSNLVIGTNKRTYNIKLISRQKEWMPTVNFDYPEVISQTLESLYTRTKEAKERKILGNGLSIDDLDFNYKTQGQADFVPIRVYNNSVKTILEMPRSVATGKLPTLLVVNDGRREQINYRYKNGRFIVDGLPKQIILLLGSGKYQKSVLITKGDR